MKNRIHKILGVGITLVIALALVAGFALPAGAAVEKINEWYQFDYPVEGAAGDWFMDTDIMRVGEITEAIDGTLYVHVQRCVDDATFAIDTGTLTITEFGTSDTGTITADIDGDWDGPERDFAAFLDWAIGPFDGTMCVTGTVTATNLSFEGSIENIADGGLTWLSDNSPHTITGGNLNVTNCGFTFSGGGSDIWINYGFTNIGSSIFKSDDGGRTWEDTEFPGGWVADMAASSIDADILYVVDGLYVYKTTDAGDEWDYLARDSLEEQLSGICGIPACSYCGFIDCDVCPSYSPPNYYPFTCPITSIDVGYDDSDNPYVFIGTRAHCSGIDLDEDTWLDEFPGEVYWIGEAGYPANWSGLGLDCYRNGTYDALAVGCAPDWADSKETYVVVTTDDDDGVGGPGDPYDSQTHVVVTAGGPCAWPEYAELQWDCVNSFASAYASRIAFPDDWEDTETLFVGVVDGDYCYDCDDAALPGFSFGCGGDVYMAMQDYAQDMNVAGISTGCEGIESVDIISLDIEGDTDEASLIAGAFCDTSVFYSYDGGWEWDESTKDPTGDMLTYVIWYEDTALAATSGCEAAVSISCVSDDVEDVGEAWNQISLIATDIAMVQFIDHSPGYVCGDSETMFMLTQRHGGPPCGPPTLSVFRHDGTYWERVLCSTLVDSDAPPMNTFKRVSVSPDFNDTECVYLSNGGHELWRTTDAGCSWDKLTFPCDPRPCIYDFVIIDEDTVITGGRSDGGPCEDSAGKVYKTTRHGARPWDEYEYEIPADAGTVISFALEPGYEDPGSILLGDDDSRVYISEDGGETWDLVGDFQDVVGDTEDTWVIFDPAYPTNPFIYAASDHVIARCEVDFDEDWADQEWEDILFDCAGEPISIDEAWGIKAAGDTALYVTDHSSRGLGVFRSLNPDTEDAVDVVFEEVDTGLIDVDPTPSLRNLWLTCDTSDEGCAENVLWSLDTGPGDDRVWIYEDTLAAPVVLAMPLDEQKLGTTDSATLSWNELCGADCYEVSLYRYCPECPDDKLDVDISDLMDCHDECGEGVCYTCTEEICIVVDDLEPGATYYWQVRVCCDEPTLSKWSEERSFMTALVAVPFADLCSPPCGDQDIILTPNFAWEAVDGATGYDIELATTETFTAGVIRGSSTVNAWVLTAPLDYATTYYWRVRAEKDGVYSAWTICLFTTMEKAVAPPPPVVVQEPPPAPQVNIPPAEMITPNWIYAIIAIGAALCVVVIVLIVRTRRPPA